jgi:PHD/YefM family antitoxin component YafN of YafNO toxin-antitoxin module
MITKVLPIEEVLSSSQLVEKIKKTPDGLKVTENGKPLFIILTMDSYENYENILRQYQHQKLREGYILMLMEEGYPAKRLRELVKRLDEIDQRFAEDSEQAINDALERSQELFKEWCEKQGVDYESLTDEKMADIIEQAIKSVRKNR